MSKSHITKWGGLTKRDQANIYRHGVRHIKRTLGKHYGLHAPIAFINKVIKAADGDLKSAWDAASDVVHAVAHPMETFMSKGKEEEDNVQEENTDTPEGEYTENMDEMVEVDEHHWPASGQQHKKQKTDIHEIEEAWKQAENLLLKNARKVKKRDKAKKMVKRKYYRGGRRRYRRYRRRYRRRRPGRIYKVPPPEKKYKDGGPSVVTAAMNSYNTPTIVAMNVMTQGSGASDRLGRHVRIVHWRLNLQIVESATVGVLQRVMVFVIKQPKGAGLPVLSDFLANTGVNSTVISNYNILNAKSYRVIFDKVFPVSPGDSADQIPLKIQGSTKLDTYFKANTGAATDVETNLLCFAVFTDRTAAQNDAPTMNYYTRVRYVDC